jgi:hypothetical protein
MDEDNVAGNNDAFDTDNEKSEIISIKRRI